MSTIDTATDSKYVVQINYTYKGVDGKYSSEINNSLFYEVQEGTFVPYADLTQEMMKLTDTTANALTTTSFLGAATAAAVQYNELVKFIGGLIAILSGLAAFVYYLYKIHQLGKK
jgi:hypothetical protein